MGFCKPMSEEVPLINTKTISKEELDAQRENAAKVQAVLRRTYEIAGAGQAVEFCGATLSLGDGCLHTEKGRVELTKNEFRILQLLLENRGKIVSREELMMHLWQSDLYVEENTLTVNVARLRKKLEEGGLEGVILTKPGRGYIIL